jgi:hypothetical protein
VAQGQSAKGWRYDPVPVEGQVGINFEPTQLFDIREIAARRHKYPYEHRFWVGVNFGRDLLTTRAKVEYREVLQISLHYLFVKSFNDLLAAVSVSKSGYPFQSWPLIRGGFEAAELMDYLHRYPEDTVKWINKEERFNSLTWLRHELPKSELRRNFYNTVNDSTSTHVNLRPIDAFSTLRSDENEIRYLSVGPNPYPIEEPNPIALASIIISYPVRVLWQSDPSIMDSNWVTRFHSFDAGADFPFGEAWNDTIE